MDLQTLLDNAVKAGRADTLKGSPQMTLGEAIATLESSVLTYEYEGKTTDKQVNFSFEYLFPTGLDSWRGSYDELAIGFTSEDFQYHIEKAEDRLEPPTATKFLEWLKEAVGKTYTGYKGGDFVMGKNTPLWVANYGHSGETGLVGIVVDDYGVELQTWKCEF